MTRQAHQLVVPYLAVLVAGLAYLNWWLAATPVDISPITPPASEMSNPAAGTEVANEDRMPSLSELKETLTRPLFQSTRKAPAGNTTEQAAPAAAEPAPQTSADQLRFVGMMRTGSSARRALIRVAGMPAAAWFEVGSDVGGWTVGKIESDRVFLERNGDRAELKLFAPRIEQAPPAP